MANVLFALRQTATDALGAVSASSSAVTHGATALADVSAVAAAHAHAYRAQTEQALALTADENALIGKQRAYLRMARTVKDINAELDSDPALAAIFNDISATHADHEKAKLSVAAE